MIDYLQGYDCEKSAENFLKARILLRDGTKISACHPKLYCERFYLFMKNEVIIDQQQLAIDVENDEARNTYMNRLSGGNNLSRTESKNTAR